jgi:hypothetical protein
MAYPVIAFNQFASGTEEDRLFLFAAPAKDIISWAGIPRKGWHMRMLYQRWVADPRKAELKDFWTTAANPDRERGETLILGPTAITVAMTGQPVIDQQQITLEHTPLINLKDDPLENLQKLAATLRPVIVARLTEAQREAVRQFALAPKEALPEIEHDYVLESALQLVQMEHDAAWFRDENDISDEAIVDLVSAMEAICRPAIVVDGQHRLIGAAAAPAPVWLPVVLIPHCTWMEQIYQFIVINEKAQRVEPSLLTDIFGSSLTKEEQRRLRDRLERARVDVEARIASVVANRDPASPFYNMVRVALPGKTPEGMNPYITDRTIRLLIDGTTRDSRGWRSDDDFYKYYVQPTFPIREEWDSWASGAWRPYWFGFWHTVGAYYDDQAKKYLKKPDARLWNPEQLTNLTKAVGLRLFQRLFMEKAVDRVRELEKMRPILVEELGEEIADKRLREKEKELAIPADVEEFKRNVLSWFLEKGVPVRFFTAQWKESLDDDRGRRDLYDEMVEAFAKSSKDERYVVRNRDVFEIREEPQ